MIRPTVDDRSRGKLKKPRAHGDSRLKSLDAGSSRPQSHRSTGSLAKAAVAPGVQRRAHRLLSCEIAFIDNASFRGRSAERTILNPPETRTPSAGRLPPLPDGTPAYFAELYSVPLLTADEERFLFRKMNYLKFIANRLRAGLNPIHPDEVVVAEIENRLAEAAEVRDRIIRANLRLEVSIARRYVDSSAEFDDLVSDGNLTLLAAVEKFDYGRGFRFSTYATHAIQRDFYRKSRRRRKDQARFMRCSEQLVTDAPDNPPDPVVGEQYLRFRKLVQLIEGELDEREKLILTMRYGLDHDNAPQTLNVIGSRLGVSKERVRQLEIRAIATLQRAAHSETLA